MHAFSSDGRTVRYDEALASLPASWECDLATNELTWSPGVYDLFGLPRGMRLERDAIVAMYDDDSRRLLETLRSDAIEKAGSFTIDARIRRADGEWRWMRLVADVQCSGGRPVRLYGTKQDVTDEYTPRRAAA